MPQGKGSQLHNRRDYEKVGHDIPDNIDQSKTKDNIVMVDMDVREAYQDIFGDALKRYNDKQKRADRKIADYYDKIEHSQNGEKLFYEDVLQWGKKEDFENNPELKEKATKALEKYAESFQVRNPNLRVIGIYIHLDEASPHLHLDYIPVAHGYSRGLDTRNSLDKALEEQGIEVKERTRKVKDKETEEEKEVELQEGRYNNRTMAWKEREREYFSGICQELGLEVEEEQHLGRKQLTVAEYKEAEMRMLEPIQKEVNRQLEYIEAMKEGGSYTNEQGEYEFVSYDESIKHLERTKEHLTDNTRAYKEGGWYYDYDSELGVTIPEGGIDHLVSEAAAESERITADANEVRDELERTLDRIHYYKGEPSKNSYGRRNEDGSFEKAMTLPEVTNEIASQQAILSQILIDLENQTVKKKSLEYGSVTYQLYCQDWAIDPQNVSEVDFATILGGLEQNRLNISDLPLNLQLEVSEAVETQWDEEIGEKLSSLNRDIDELDMHEILNSSLTNNLVLEVQSDVIGQLHRAGMLKVSPLEANMKVDHHKIIDNLKDKLQNFVEQVKEHAKELVERTFHKRKSR